MDVQTCSPLYSLEEALENVSQLLVYDPTTKQLCIRSQSPHNTHLQPTKSDLDPGSKYTSQCFTELRKQSDGDSGYCAISLEGNIDNDNVSQQSIFETRPRIFPNENVDDLNLSLPSQDQHSNKSKLLFFQNVLTKLTSNVVSVEPNDLPSPAAKSSLNSLSGIIRSDFPTQSKSIIQNIEDTALCLGERPPHLPPKSGEEVRRHQFEFNEILRQAKKRELKEIKLKKRIQLKQFREEEEISGAIRCWTRDILPNWPSSCGSKRTRELWWNGVPSPVRPKVWSLAIGNELNITEELFRICVERSRERIWTKQFVCRRSSNPYPASCNATKHHRRVASQPAGQESHFSVEKLADKLADASIREDAEGANKNCKTMPEEADEEDKNESVAFQINLDVSRTFPQLGLFQENGPLHQSLSDILAAYAVFRPDTSYCQGMSFLAAMLLLNLDSPADAFTAFANLLNSQLMLAFYRLVPEKMSTVYEFYDRQLQVHLPRLAAHLRLIGLHTELFFVDQVFTIFSRSLPFECTCRVWDLFLRDGDDFIFRASLAILAMFEEVLIGLEFVEAAKFLSHLPDDMDTAKYFNVIASIKLVPPKEWQPVVINETLAKMETITSFAKKRFPF